MKNKVLTLTLLTCLAGPLCLATENNPIPSDNTQQIIYNNKNVIYFKLDTILERLNKEKIDAPNVRQLVQQFKNDYKNLEIHTSGNKIIITTPENFGCIYDTKDDEFYFGEIQNNHENGHGVVLMPFNTLLKVEFKNEVLQEHIILTPQNSKELKSLEEFLKAPPSSETQRLEELKKALKMLEEKKKAEKLKILEEQKQAKELKAELSLGIKLYDFDSDEKFSGPVTTGDLRTLFNGTYLGDTSPIKSLKNTNKLEPIGLVNGGYINLLMKLTRSGELKNLKQLKFQNNTFTIRALQNLIKGIQNGDLYSIDTISLNNVKCKLHGGAQLLKKTIETAIQAGNLQQDFKYYIPDHFYKVLDPSVPVTDEDIRLMIKGLRTGEAKALKQLQFVNNKFTNQAMLDLITAIRDGDLFNVKSLYMDLTKCALPEGAQLLNEAIAEAKATGKLNQDFKYHTPDRFYGPHVEILIEQD